MVGSPPEEAILRVAIFLFGHKGRIGASAIEVFVVGLVGDSTGVQGESAWRSRKIEAGRAANLVIKIREAGGFSFKSPGETWYRECFSNNKNSEKDDPDTLISRQRDEGIRSRRLSRNAG